MDVDLEFYVPEVKQIIDEHVGRAAKEDLAEGPGDVMYGEAKHYIAATKFDHSDVLSDLPRDVKLDLVHLYATKYL